MTIFRRIKCAKVQPSDNNNRITVTWVGPDAVERTYAVNQRALNRYDTAEEAKAALDTFTQNNFGYTLTDIWLHRNRDGVTWAIATGDSPPDVWPEDKIT
jgi:hypothetical protein